MTKETKTTANLEEKMAETCGEIAHEVVRDAGGFVTFDQYDEAIVDKFLPAPIGWCAGWGNGMLLHNQRIMAAWKAVDMGLLAQTEGGYKCLNNNHAH